MSSDIDFREVSKQFNVCRNAIREVREFTPLDMPLRRHDGSLPDGYGSELPAERILRYAESQHRYRELIANRDEAIEALANLLGISDSEVLTIVDDAIDNTR